MPNIALCHRPGRALVAQVRNLAPPSHLALRIPAHAPRIDWREGELAATVVDEAAVSLVVPAIVASADVASVDVASANVLSKTGDAGEKEQYHCRLVGDLSSVSALIRIVEEAREDAVEEDNEDIPATLTLAASDVHALYAGDQGLPPLDEVIVEVRDAQAYARLTQDAASKTQLLTTLAQMPVIRQYDCCAVTSDDAVTFPLRIVACQPFVHGRVDVETTRVVLVKAPAESVANGRVSTPSSESPLSASGQLAVHVLDREYPRNALIPSVADEDRDRIVVVSLDTLMELDIVSGSLVFLCALGRRALCRLYTSSAPVDNARAFISTTTLHNLGFAQRPNRHTGTFASFTATIELVRDTATLIQEAEDVELSPISFTNRPPTAAQRYDVFNRAIRDLFQSTRPILKLEDVLSVPVTALHVSPVTFAPVGGSSSMGLKAHETFLDTEAAAAAHGSDHVVTATPLFHVFFKVTRLQGTSMARENGYAYVDGSKAKLMAGLPVTDFQPLTMQPQIVWRLPHRKLLEFSLPFLHATARRAFQSPASVLVMGSTGSGRRSTVTHVAGALGMNVVSESLLQLVASVIYDKQQKQTLEEAFGALLTRSSGAAPCFLVLRDLFAFSAPQSWTRPTSAASAAGKDEDDTAAQAQMDPIEKEKWERRMCSLFLDFLKQTTVKSNRLGKPIIVVGITDALDALPLTVQNCFSAQVRVALPSEQERMTMLRVLTKSLHLAADVSLAKLAELSTGLTPKGLGRWVDEADLRSRSDCRRRHPTHKKILPYIDRVLSFDHFKETLSAAKPSQGAKFTLTSTPTVAWADIGGLESAKQAIMETIQLPLSHAHMFAAKAKRRSGILLYGPPGTGKTLLAKAVATATRCSFLSVKGPELMNMYVGESEKNVREVFQRAREAAPCVIFFDELDSVAGKRGTTGDSGGVTDRVVSQLLSELDGVLSADPADEDDDGDNAGTARQADIFVIGATNRPDLLDASLLRPGRFDKLVYLDVATTRDAQHKLLQALTRKLPVHPSECNLEKVLDQCPLGKWTGADFYALSVDAMMKALGRTIGRIEAAIDVTQKRRQGKRGVTAASSDVPPRLSPIEFLESHCEEPEEMVKVEITDSDFILAAQSLVPSVSEDELRHYRALQGHFQQNPTGR